PAFARGDRRRPRRPARRRRAGAGARRGGSADRGRALVGPHRPPHHRRLSGGGRSMSLVGVNLLWLVPGVVGGSEVSTVTTLHALAAEPPDDLDHVLFALAPFVEAHPELAEAFDLEVLSLSGRLKGLRVGAEQTWLAARARRRGVDAMHHLGGTMPLVPGPPAVLSIHD